MPRSPNEAFFLIHRRFTCRLATIRPTLMSYDYYKAAEKFHTAYPIPTT